MKRFLQVGGALFVAFVIVLIAFKGGKLERGFTRFAGRMINGIADNVQVVVVGSIVVFVIIWAALRCASFIVAAALCGVGLIGRGCQKVGLWVAHKDDREFLNRF